MVGELRSSQETTINFLCQLVTTDLLLCLTDIRSSAAKMYPNVPLSDLTVVVDFSEAGVRDVRGNLVRAPMFAVVRPSPSGFEEWEEFKAALRVPQMRYPTSLVGGKEVLSVWVKYENHGELQSFSTDVVVPDDSDTDADRADMLRRFGAGSTSDLRTTNNIWRGPRYVFETAMVGGTCQHRSGLGRCGRPHSYVRRLTFGECDEVDLVWVGLNHGYVGFGTGGERSRVWERIVKAAETVVYARTIRRRETGAGSAGATGDDGGVDHLSQA